MCRLKLKGAVRWRAGYTLAEEHGCPKSTKKYYKISILTAQGGVIGADVQPSFHGAIAISPEQGQV